MCSIAEYFYELCCILTAQGGGGGDSHMKGAEMLVETFELNRKVFISNPKRDLDG